MEHGLLLNLYEDEKIVLVLRRHWLAFLQNILVTAVLLIIFFIGVFILGGRLNSPASALCLTTPLIGDNLGKGALIIFSSIYLLSTCAFFYVSWLDYYLDVFVVTNKRILRVEQLVLFGQNVSETSLQHIQDVSSRVKGVIYTILDVGTVYIETAGERANFTFTFIKDPGDLAARILELQKEMWGDEGFKEDLMFERKNEKIEKMNVGNNMMEEKAKAKDAATADKNVVQNNIESPSIGSGNQEIKEKLEGNLGEAKEEINYKDGRKITPEGVIWQSEQELSEDILNTLNEMDE
ncbi:MAG: PH domain-containing protein [Patescibacteria group bacterium]|nr:PH domain-containing protein [Patescibacteria group bacterium]